MQEKYVMELLEKGRRADGRRLDQFREIFVEKGVIKKAEGSALVTLGKTKVMAGVKMGIGEPFPDAKDEGILIVNAEFSPIASPEFESGPPSEDAIELARIVDRTLREGKCIQLNKLSISEDKVFIVFIDLYPLNDDGNLLDASALAALAALTNTKVPKVENGEIVRGEFVGDLPLSHKPLVVSVCTFGDKILVDPSWQEERVVNSKLAVGVREDEKICALQKQGSGTLRFSDIERILDMAIEKSKELRKLVG